MAKIIISYRRSDSDVFAGRVRDRIAGCFGDDSVFIDVDNIPFGKDFRVHIQEALTSADTVLVVVGPGWLGAGKGGHSRIKDDSDPVRIEVETALSKGIPIIPILVGQTNMPKPEQLPESIQNFAFINAAPVDTGRDFHRDLDRVIATINTILGGPGHVPQVGESAIVKPPPREAVFEKHAGPFESKQQATRNIASASGVRSHLAAEKAGEGLLSAMQTDAASPFASSRSSHRFWLVSFAGIVCGSVIVVGAAWSILSKRNETSAVPEPVPPVSVHDQGQKDVPPLPVLAAPQSEASPPNPQPAAPEPAAATARGENTAVADPGADVVRAFYTALGHGDGTAAAKFVVPERRTGHFDPQGMTKFFSSLKKPLQLLSVVPNGENTYQATYTYMATTKVCNNSVVVALTKRNGQYLIQSIDSRGGC